MDISKKGLLEVLTTTCIKNAEITDNQLELPTLRSQKEQISIQHNQTMPEIYSESGYNKNMQTYYSQHPKPGEFFTDYMHTMTYAAKYSWANNDMMPYQPYRLNYRNKNSYVCKQPSLYKNTRQLNYPQDDKIYPQSSPWSIAQEHNFGHAVYHTSGLYNDSQEIPHSTNRNNEIQNKIQLQMYPTKEVNRLNYLPLQSNEAASIIPWQKEDNFMVETEYSPGLLNKLLQQSHFEIQNIEQSPYLIRQTKPDMNPISPQHPSSTETPNINPNMRELWQKPLRTSTCMNSSQVKQNTSELVDSFLKSTIGSHVRNRNQTEPNIEKETKEKYQMTEKTGSITISNKKRKRVQAENKIKETSPPLYDYPSETWIRNQQISTQPHGQNLDLNCRYQNNSIMGQVSNMQPSTCNVNSLLTGEFHSQNIQIPQLSNLDVNSPPTQYQPEYALQSHRIDKDNTNPPLIEVNQSSGVQSNPFLLQNTPSNHSQNSTIPKTSVSLSLPKLSLVWNRSTKRIYSLNPYCILQDSKIGKSSLYNCNQVSDPVSVIHSNNFPSQKLQNPELQDGNIADNHCPNQTQKTIPIFESQIYHQVPYMYDNSSQQRNMTPSTINQEEKNNNSELIEKEGTSQISELPKGSKIFKPNNSNLMDKFPYVNMEEKQKIMPYQLPSNFCALQNKFERHDYFYKIPDSNFFDEIDIPYHELYKPFVDEISATSSIGSTSIIDPDLCGLNKKKKNCTATILMN